MEALVLRHLGRERRYVIESGALIARGETGEKRTELGSVKSVRVARIGNLEMCALTLDGGSESTIATDESGSRAAFAELVRALYDALAPRSVPFIAGSWLVASIILASCIVLLAVGALLYTGVIDAPAFHVRGLVMAVVCAVVGPIGAFAQRPRALTSKDALAKVLPR